MADPLYCFVSSKMQELKPERQRLKALLPTLGSTLLPIEAWVFEDDAPASDRSIRDVYLQRLRDSALYIGLFWNQYGEYTIDEFDRATEWGIERHIYVKDVDASERDPKLTAFLDKIGGVEDGITAKWFKTEDELAAAVEKSVAQWFKDRLTRRGDTEATRLRGPGDFLGSAYKPEKLIGRDAILQDIREIVAANGRVLLRAHGGAGKTAIAATAAYNFVTTSGKEALWLRTGSSDVNALAESLGGSPDMRRAIAAAKGDAKAQAVRAAIGDAALLVLDDCWNGRALGDLLRMLPPGLPVIATARQRYPMGTRIDVDDLPLTDAVAMLKHYAQIDETDTSHDADAEKLVTRLGCLAFAVEIAGKTLHTRDYTPAELLDRMGPAYALAHVNDFGGESDERRSAAALIETSLRELPDDAARNVFFAFGAFETPVNAAELLAEYQALTPNPSPKGEGLQSPAESPAEQGVSPSPSGEAAFGRGGRGVRDALETLADHGLARRFRADDLNIETYRVHDVAHEYARDQRSADDVGRAIRACLAYTGRYA
ncbi:DUF4062 domain-containing protein, partial [bacterium]|nr:DUF4062 domain-containing protein [bacterium]